MPEIILILALLSGGLFSAGVIMRQRNPIGEESGFLIFIGLLALLALLAVKNPGRQQMVLASAILAFIAYVMWPNKNGGRWDARR